MPLRVREWEWALLARYVHTRNLLKWQKLNSATEWQRRDTDNKTTIYNVWGLTCVYLKWKNECVWWINKCILVLCVPCLMSSVREMDCLAEEALSGSLWSMRLPLSSRGMQPLVFPVCVSAVSAGSCRFCLYTAMELCLPGPLRPTRGGNGPRGGSWSEGIKGEGFSSSVAIVQQSQTEQDCRNAQVESAWVHGHLNRSLYVVIYHIGPWDLPRPLSSLPTAPPV